MKENVNNNLNNIDLPKKMNEINEAPKKPRTHKNKNKIQQHRTNIELPNIFKDHLQSQHQMERNQLQTIIGLQILRIFLQAQPNLNLLSHLPPTPNPTKDSTPNDKYSTPSSKIPNDKTSLCKLLESNKPPQIFDLSPQGITQAFSSRQHSLPPEIIAEEWNSSEGSEVGIFLTNTQHTFGYSYTPLLSTSTTKQNKALQYAKYISGGDGVNQDNLSTVLSTSTTHSLLTTPLCTDIFDQDAVHNTYKHVTTVFESVHDLAYKKIFLEGKIILLVLNASLSPADTIIWDYRRILQTLIRYLDNISYIHTYQLYIHDNNNIFSSTSLKQATFNNTIGMMIITIDTFETYSYQPPPRSTKDPATTRLRGDILKKQLNDGSWESAYDFINKSLQGKIHEEASIASSLAEFERAAFHERPSPISKHPKQPKVTKTTNTSAST